MHPKPKSRWNCFAEDWMAKGVFNLVSKSELRTPGDLRFKEAFTWHRGPTTCDRLTPQFSWEQHMDCDNKNYFEVGGPLNLPNDVKRNKTISSDDDEEDTCKFKNYSQLGFNRYRFAKSKNYSDAFAERCIHEPIAVLKELIVDCPKDPFAIARYKCDFDPGKVNVYVINDHTEQVQNMDLRDIALRFFPMDLRNKYCTLIRCGISNMDALNICLEKCKDKPKETFFYNLAVVPEEYPSKVLRSAELDAVIKLFFDRLKKDKPINDAFKKIQIQRMKGMLLLTCMGPREVIWVKTKFKESLRSKWFDYTVMPIWQIPKVTIVTAKFEDSLDLSNQLIFDFLVSQNLKIVTKSWKVIHRIEDRDMVTLTFEIDNVSVKILKRYRDNLFYHFGKVNVDFGIYYKEEYLTTCNGNKIPCDSWQFDEEGRIQDCMKKEGKRPGKGNELLKPQKQMKSQTKQDCPTQSPRESCQPNKFKNSVVSNKRQQSNRQRKQTVTPVWNTLPQTNSIV